MGDRRTYIMRLVVNGQEIRRVIIDSHYEENHPDMKDEVIIEIVKQMNGLEFNPIGTTGEWTYYSKDRERFAEGLYRIVWCQRKGQDFIGIINCFRRD